MGMLLTRSLDRAGRVHEAMLCRGYAGTLPLFDHFSIRRQERLFVLCFAACCACLLFLT
jgi:cobalt/nickel transport system permease protein